MRDELRKHDGSRMRFRATVERFGSRRGWNGYSEDTFLLTDVRLSDTNELACDHLWFKCGQWSWELEVGTAFEFDARVDAYVKGYQGRRAEELGLSTSTADYHLERPSKVVVTGRPESGRAAQKTPMTTTALPNRRPYEHLRIEDHS
jgi:hypothetical protein